MALKRSGRPRSSAARTTRPARKASRAGSAAPERARAPQKRTIAGLSEASIVTTARALIRRDGVDALSMRSLAGELGVSPMAVYYHIADKDQLLDRVRDAVVSEVVLAPIARTGWSEQLRAHATAGIVRLAEYPGLLAHAALRPPTVAELRLTRHGLGILLAAGFDPKAAASAMTALNGALFGLFVTHRALSQGAAVLEDASDERLDEALALQRKLGLRRAVDFTIDTLVKGLRRTLAEGKRRAS